MEKILSDYFFIIAYFILINKYWTINYLSQNMDGTYSSKCKVIGIRDQIYSRFRYELGSSIFTNPWEFTFSEHIGQELSSLSSILKQKYKMYLFIVWWNIQHQAQCITQNVEFYLSVCTGSTNMNAYFWNWIY